MTTAATDLDIRTGSCADLLPTVERASVQLVISSPPYNLGKAYEKRTSLEEYVEEMKPIAAELVAIMAEGASLCWQVGNWIKDGMVLPLDFVFYPMFRDLNLTLRNRVIWAYGHGLHCKRRFSGRHESILWFTKGDDYTFNLDSVRVPQKQPDKRYYDGKRKGEIASHPSGKNPSDVILPEEATDFWSITNVKNNHPEKTDHPCQFPELLVSRFIRALTNLGDLVVDPFAGSGTVGKVAIELRRRALLMEREPSYLEIIRQRCANLEPQFPEVVS